MNDDAQCREFQDILDRFSQGELSRTEMDLLRLHASACEHCGMLMKMREHLASTLREELEARVSADLIDGMWRRVRDGLESTQSVGLRRFGFHTSHRWLVPALAASTCVLLLASIMLFAFIHRLHDRERAMSLALQEQELLLEHYRQQAAESGVTRHETQPFRTGRLRARTLRDGLSIAELKSLLQQMPPDAQVLTGPDIDKLLSHLPTWQELVFGAKLRSIDDSDGLQSSEALWLLDSLALDPEEIISPTQLIAFADLQR